ncbi:MAG: glutathionylspermidine synthase family protein [Chloroherpetonaceae bacterium]|nr:glutathionylspermidine synthase family protein [Chloroherpetonaceae bacterium]MCS7211159.1 glutathionylspermidine synthase family protein [Chloroherpetonaceae bacterium]MDW8020423.1 glutathionylspermidine synthase family protein [Chloroherpetonaceae bacterium]MDW8465788.1 glutathionylspermidine synthase family protein [Chloroherpetonaceae bacterium]
MTENETSLPFMSHHAAQLSDATTYQARYEALAEQLYRTHILTDPWLNGEERFLLEPVILSAKEAQAMQIAAETVGQVYDELAQLIWQEPNWLDDFFHLTPYQKLMWLSSGGRWHFIARLDVFQDSAGGIKICEMNSDTPSGEAEAVFLNELLHPNTPKLCNPNAHFESQFVDAMLAMYRADVACPKASPTIGIIYPTDLTEDLSMILLYKHWFEKRGFETVLGSPFNLSKTPDALRLFSRPIDIVIRHYKTDWWGERLPVWYDEDDYPDPYPMHNQLLAVLEAEAMHQVSVLNPFGAVLTQNKLTLAFLWAHRHRFSPASQAAIKAYIPETYRLIDVSPEQLCDEKDQWVMKSDYGCEGAEVILGKLTTDEVWKLSLAQAVKTRWIVQKYFDAKVLPQGGVANFGVYLIGGKAAGFYTRVSKGCTENHTPLPTDYTTPCAATFVAES